MPAFDEVEALSDPGFAVYVHWPFCQSKCPYCDFNSHVRSGGIHESGFLNAYLEELRTTASLVGNRSVRSIFFGGGTPSLMAPETVTIILNEIARLWTLGRTIEITLEANPSSVEVERFRGYASAGVNRISLGVQALRDTDLRSLGRLHDVASARYAIEVARANFERVSFDLIYARPGQTDAAWREELSDALTIGPDHLSLYQLTIEPGTAFANLHAAGKLRVPDADMAATLYETTQELCEKIGLPAYEISNHAQPGHECWQNLIYWRYGEYAGVGPGAHGRLNIDGDRLATQTEHNPERWLACVKKFGHGYVEREPITRRQQADEMMLMGLRLSEGLSIERLGQETGHRIDGLYVNELVRDGLLIHEHHRDEPGYLIVTAKGRFVLNELVLRVSENCRPITVNASTDYGEV